MDNPLTPNKIQRLMHLAEDKSFHLPRRLQLNNDENHSLAPSLTPYNKTGTNYESSSGILDLDRMEGFGESGIGNMSLSKSTAFNPGEITGRSTGTEEVDVRPALLGSTRVFEEYGRHSVALDSITSHMDKQTSEINDLMRHSIATNYSFHSKRDLTADEASLVMREAPLPIQHSTQVNFQESALMSNSNVSMGAYFKNRCPEFGKILSNVDSPDRYSAVDASASNTNDTQNNQNDLYTMDQTLDCVPVRQPRNTDIDKVPENPNPMYNLPYINKTNETGNFAIPKNPADYKNISHVKNKEQPVGSNELPLKQVTSSAAKKPFMTSTKPADVLLRNLHSSMLHPPEDTECSLENSLSLSKIADYLGKQSNVSITDMLQLNKHAKQNRKLPLTEINVNVLEKNNQPDVFVTSLKDTKKGETGSSAASVSTVINMDALRLNEAEYDVPDVIVTRVSDGRDSKVERLTRSNSPSSKSRSTLSTVQENKMSIKSGDSPIHNSIGNASNVPSPNVDYKELDKSVVWHEVLQQKQFKEDGLAKDKWAEIVTTPAHGFIGVSVPVTVTVTTLTDSWLTAKFQFDKLPNDGKDLMIELPRLPLLLSPGKSEKFTIQITSNVEINDELPFTVYLKDASIDGDIHQKGNLDVNIKMPTVQALSCDGVNVISYAPMREGSYVTKYFVLISDCPVDLQLELLVAEGDSMFFIKSVQEIRKADVSKALMDRQGIAEDNVKVKAKGPYRQLCRLSSGNAIKVLITFNAPRLSDLELTDKMVTFKGALHVNMIGIQNVIKKVSLVGTVGSSHLVIEARGGRLQLTHEPTSLTLSNTGAIAGVWNVKFKSITGGDGSFPFKVSSVCIEIRAGGCKELSLMYTGPSDAHHEGFLILEDATNGNKTTLEIVGGSERPKTFPIKTNFNNMSWVRAERKELSLKNSTNKKIQLRCQIVGDGFSVDLPGVETRGTFILTFGPLECRPLPVLFAPNTCTPYAAALHLVFDKNSDFSRKVKLHGCAAGEGGARWSGLVTYGDTALVRAVAGAPVPLPLYNRSHAPAFVAARVHFNLQYRWLSGQAALEGGRRVVGARGRHSLVLRLPWARLQRRRATSTALGTLTLLTGSEHTRRRILRIIRDEASGAADTSQLPEHLRALADQFDGEDEAVDASLQHFTETKASLNELLDSIHELTAQIDLPQELHDENTILIADDTVLEHHTLCD